MKHEKIYCQECGAFSDSLLSKCGKQAIDDVDQAKSCNRYKKGQILFFEGNRPLGLFCVNRGAIKLYKTGIDGKEQIISFAQAGDFVGYRALVADETYETTAEAVEETVACFIPLAQVNDMLETQPHFSKTLMKSLCHELGIANERLTHMAQKPVRERLAETLLILLEVFRRGDQATNQIRIQLPREDLANVAGTSTETVIRLLAEFKEDRYVDLQGKRITILDPQGLQRVARVEQIHAR